mgnify:CR=1 FL=1
MTELEFLLEAMRRNARVNQYLLDHLTDADLALSYGFRLKLVEYDREKALYDCPVQSRSPGFLGHLPA